MLPERLLLCIRAVDQLLHAAVGTASAVQVAAVRGVLMVLSKQVYEATKDVVFGPRGALCSCSFSKEPVRSKSEQKHPLENIVFG